MSEQSYLARVTSRIIRMFELYISNIDPDDSRFQQFISNYVASKGVNNPETIPYSQLYAIVRQGIREYIKRDEKRREK